MVALILGDCLGRLRRPANVAVALKKLSDAQDKRLLETRRNTLHADRQPFVCQPGRGPGGWQTYQRDQEGGRDPIHVVVKLPTVDLVRKVHFNGEWLHWRGRREQHVEVFE